MVLVQWVGPWRATALAGMVYTVMATGSGLGVAWADAPSLAAAPSSDAQALAEVTCGGVLACRTDRGSYYIHLPEGAPRGAILFLHGHRGSGLNEIGNQGMLAMADRLGVAFVAPDGLDGTWSFPGAPQAKRDEFAFLAGVAEDVARRFSVPRERMMLSGFSSGGFMTWYTACHDSSSFAGFAPVAGAFWMPLPEACATSIPDLLHVHGTTDPVVPMAGRALGGGRWRQGDVNDSFDVWLRQAGLSREGAEETQEGGLACRTWRIGSRTGTSQGNGQRSEGGPLQLCLHDGGHSVRAEWLEQAYRGLAVRQGWPLPQTPLSGR